MTSEFGDARHLDVMLKIPIETAVPTTTTTSSHTRRYMIVGASWLRQVESYLKDAGMAGLASAWGWRLPDGGRRSTVARWTRRRAAPAYAPITDLT